MTTLKEESFAEESFAVQPIREIFAFRGNKLSRIGHLRIFRGNKLSRMGNLDIFQNSKIPSHTETFTVKPLKTIMAFSYGDFYTCYLNIRIQKYWLFAKLLRFWKISRNKLSRMNDFEKIRGINFRNFGKKNAKSRNFLPAKLSSFKVVSLRTPVIF